MSADAGGPRQPISVAFGPARLHCALHGERRPNVMKRIVIVLIAAAVCASCRSPAPNGIPNASDPPSVAGQYHFSTADLRIDLDIRPDGTYFASMNSWARVTEEHGVWGIEGDNVVLKCRSGGLQMPIRRLGPVRQRPAGMFQILEPDSQLGRAIIFSKS